ALITRTYWTFSFLEHWESRNDFSRAGGRDGQERRGFQGFQKAGLRLRTDNSGNRLSPSGSSLVAANLRLAGLRYVSEFSGAAGFPHVLGNEARRPAVCSHCRALQIDQ